jgi:uncharacterized protein YndB with AHSA1/START domain
MAAEARKAFFVIADISGYTRFLAETEIAHAKGVLEELFGAVVGAIRSPLAISGLQGDAVFAYAVDDAVVARQFILDFAEKLYGVFADTRERMRINTTCTCNACARIGGLDLKVVVHHGEFVTQETAGRSELAGRDVIAAFRLLKNSVAEKTGLSAYALITDAAVARMDMAAYFGAAQHFAEEYEHIGRVGFVVHALEPAWRRARDARRVFVDSADLLVPEILAPLPLSPEATFRLLVDPHFRAKWVAADRITVDDNAGRVETGSQYHCHHGKHEFRFEVVDWRPGQYVTAQWLLPLGLSFLETEELAPVGEGTLVKVRFSRLGGGGFAGRLARPLIEGKMRKDLLAQGAAICQRMREEADRLLALSPASAPDRAPEIAGLAELAARKLAA